jgi:hypothetical protein
LCQPLTWSAQTIFKVSALPANQKCVTYFVKDGQSYCSTVPIVEKPFIKPVLTLDPIQLQFDSRPWKLGWKNATAISITHEYILPGQTVERWSELVTTQQFGNLKPETFAANMIRELKSLPANPKTNIISSTPDSVLYEFQVLSGTEQQHEIQRVFSKNGKTYVIHYCKRVPQLDPKTRSAWIRRLQMATVK